MSRTPDYSEYTDQELLEQMKSFSEDPTSDWGHINADGILVEALRRQASRDGGTAEEWWVAALLGYYREVGKYYA